MNYNGVDEDNIYVPVLQRGDVADYHLITVVNPTWNCSGRLKTEKDEILNAVMGLGGEAGEVVDLHKKIFFHTPKGDRREEILSELGDVLYYFNKVRSLYGFTMKEIAEFNRNKLSERHGKRY